MASCFNKGDCLKTNTDKVRIIFKKKADGKSDTITLNSVTAQNFTTPLISNAQVLNIFDLRIDPNQRFTNFIFEYKYTRNKKDTTRNDTLKITYRPLARVSATDCGAFLYFTDLNYVKTGFDSIRIVNPQLLSDGAITNIQIFL